MEANCVHNGDAAETLREMPESSVHTCVTSPPYYGQRDYDVDGQIGLEETLDEYIAEIVEVGEALRRVLRDDGTWWLNLGDKYANKPTGSQPEGKWSRPSRDQSEEAREQIGIPDGFREKQKMLVPHRVAIRLQDSGWVLRNTVIWNKSNAMPEAVKDRCPTSHEYIFLLTPKPQYYSDFDAIRKPHKEKSLRRRERADTERWGEEKTGQTEHTGFAGDDLHPAGKIPRDVWEMPVASCGEAHFAAFPEQLPRRCIKATCPKKVCAECGQPYERRTETVNIWERDPSEVDRPQTKRALELAEEHGLTDEHFEAARDVGIGNLDGSEGNPYERVDDRTEKLAIEAAEVLGSYYREALLSETKNTDEWKQACDCDTDETEPGIVIDPFAGRGTTLSVAKEQDRRFVGIELNPEYVALCEKEAGITVTNPEYLRDDDEQEGIEAFAATDGGAE